MSRKRWSVSAAGLMAMTMMLAGCGSSNKPKWEVRLGATGDIIRRPVEVHLTGVDQGELALWENISVTEYWRPGTDFRGSKLRNTTVAENRVKVMRFGPGRDASQVYTDGRKDPNDPWNRWLARAEGKPLFLVVLADLPGQFDEPAQSADPRRLVLPLDPKRWKGRPRVIRIEIEDLRLRAVTEPQEKRAKKRLGLF